MNVFFTGMNPITCANEHCIVHTRKMIVEYAQLLSTAHHVLDKSKAPQGIYKTTHMNHPSAKWVRISKAHYDWLYICLKQLCDNFYRATGKHHKTSVTVLDLLSQAPRNIPNKWFIQPPQAMPDEYQSKLAIHGYRKYIIAKLEEWQSREKPINIGFYSTPSWFSPLRA